MDSADTHLTDLVIMDIRENEYNPHQLEYILGWISDDGTLIEDNHARVDLNNDFENYCTIKID